MVSLTKNQTVSLAKTSGSSLSRIAVGLGWDPIKKKSGFLGGLFGGRSDEIDLDASVVMLDAVANPVDVVWFRKFDSSCGSLHHRGDNLTGEGEGDDEVIDINLNSLPSNVCFLAITVNSFRGQTFNEVDNAFCRIIDTASNDKEICNYKLEEQGPHTGVLIASLKRNGSDWDFTAQGLPCKGSTVEAMIPTIRQALV
jgi:tellurium resistance protein TerZ